MSSVFRVVIHYGSDYGYIEYDPGTGALKVSLANENKRQEVLSYLSTKRVLRKAQHTLRDFTERVALPTESLETLKLALTRMWEATGVYVDWSRPAT